MLRTVLVKYSGKFQVLLSLSLSTHVYTEYFLNINAVLSPNHYFKSYVLREKRKEEFFSPPKEFCNNIFQCILLIF